MSTIIRPAIYLIWICPKNEVTETTSINYDETAESSYFLSREFL